MPVLYQWSSSSCCVSSVHWCWLDWLYLDISAWVRSLHPLLDWTLNGIEFYSHWLVSQKSQTADTFSWITDIKWRQCLLKHITLILLQSQFHFMSSPSCHTVFRFWINLYAIFIKEVASLNNLPSPFKFLSSTFLHHTDYLNWSWTWLYLPIIFYFLFFIQWVEFYMWKWKVVQICYKPH